MHPIEELLLLRVLGPCSHELLLGSHVRPHSAGAAQAVLLLESHDGALKLEEPLAQIADPLPQPVNRLVDRLTLHVQLVLHIDLGHGVGDLGRLARVAQRCLNQDEIGSGRSDAQACQHCADGAVHEVIVLFGARRRQRRRPLP